MILYLSRKIKWVAVVGLWLFHLLPSASAVTIIGGDIRYLRPPSKQGRLLEALGVGGIELKTEPAEKVDRAGEGRLRRVAYLPCNTGELVVILKDLVIQATLPHPEGPPFLEFVRNRNRQHPDLDHGYHAAYGKLVAVCDGEKSVEIDMIGLVKAYPNSISVLPPAPWQAPWTGSVGLAFRMPQGPLHVYFPTRYNDLKPDSPYRKSRWTLERRNGVPTLFGRELHSMKMLHALASEGAPKFDALWVFYDGELVMRAMHYEWSRDVSFLRAGNQSNDYAHHQTLRLVDEHLSSEECKVFYTKMWAHMQQHSKPDLMEQLRALEAEEDVPFLRELEEKGILDEKLIPEHPFTFRQMSLLQAYATMSLPMTPLFSDWVYNMIEIIDFLPQDERRERRAAMGDMSWSGGAIYVRGGAESQVPDGLWDGRFLLFPHAHGHMINTGYLGCNNGGINPHSSPRRFRDGVHCGFAKVENIWWIKDYRDLTSLVRSVWQSPGRFWYEKKPVQPAPMPPLSAPEEDRKPAARPTGPLTRPEETQPLLETSEEATAQNGGWRAYLQATPIPLTGHTIGSAAAAVGVLASSTPTARRLIAAHPITTGVVVTAGIAGGAYYAARAGNERGQEGVRIAPEALKFVFSNAEDTQALTVTITCGEHEPVKVVLHKEQKTTLCVQPGGSACQHKLCLYTLLEDAAGKVTLYKEVEGELHEAGWLTKQPMRKAESILKRMKEKVAKSNPSSSNARWNWLPGRGNSEEAPSMNPIGYLLIGDVTSVKEVLDQWQREGQYNPRTHGTTATPLNELEEAMEEALYEADPHRTIYCDGWYDFEQEKGKADGWLAEAIKSNPWLENMQLRIITNRGEVRWEAS